MGIQHETFEMAKRPTAVQRVCHSRGQKRTISLECLCSGSDLLPLGYYSRIYPYLGDRVVFLDLPGVLA